MLRSPEGKSGEFKEASVGNWFTYQDTKDAWALEDQEPHGVRELRNEREAAMALLDTKEGLNRINTKGRSVLPDHVGRDFHKPAPHRAPKTATSKRGFLAVVSSVLKSLGI